MVLEITRVTKVVNHSTSSIEIRQFERGDVLTLPKGGVATCDIPIPWHSFTHPADKFMRVFFYASQRYHLLWQRDQHILTGDINNGHPTWPNGSVLGPRDLYIYGSTAQTYGIRLYDAGKSPPPLALNPVPKSGMSGFSAAKAEEDAPETAQAALLAEAPDYIRVPRPAPRPRPAGCRLKRWHRGKKDDATGKRAHGDHRACERPAHAHQDAVLFNPAPSRTCDSIRSR